MLYVENVIFFFCLSMVDTRQTVRTLNYDPITFQLSDSSMGEAVDGVEITSKSHQLNQREYGATALDN